jgi:Ca2+-dependent lipid-binding protein
MGHQGAPLRKKKKDLWERIQNGFSFCIFRVIFIRLLRTTTLTMGVLTVVLDKITNLRDADGIGKSDPYVKFELEKDNWVFDKTLGKFTSSKKQNDCNPVYGETFTFENVPTTENMMLRIKIMDDDFGLDDFLGGCDLNLEKMSLSEEPTDVEKVIDNKKGKGWFSKKANIYLQISFKE